MIYVNVANTLVIWNFFQINLLNKVEYCCKLSENRSKIDFNLLFLRESSCRIELKVLQTIVFRKNYLQEIFPKI
jgi:hypothetical protein